MNDTHVLQLLTEDAGPLSLPHLDSAETRSRNPKYGYWDRGITFVAGSHTPESILVQYLRWQGRDAEVKAPHYVTSADLDIVVFDHAREFIYGDSDEDCEDWVCTWRDDTPPALNCPCHAAFFVTRVAQKQPLLQILGWLPIAELFIVSRNIPDENGKLTPEMVVPVKRLLAPSTYPNNRDKPKNKTRKED